MSPFLTVSPQLSYLSLVRQNAALCGNGLKQWSTRLQYDYIVIVQYLAAEGVQYLAAEGADQRSFGSPRSILRIKPRMYANGLLPEATTTTPITT